MKNDALRPAAPTTLRFAASIESARADAAVVFAAADGKTSRRVSTGVPAAARAQLDDWLARPGPFGGKCGEVTLLPAAGRDGPRLWAIAGLGAAKDIEPWRAGRAAAAALKALARHRPRRVVLAMATDLPAAVLPPADLARHLVRGAVEGPYRFARYRSDAPPASAPALVLAGAPAGDGAVRRAAREGAIEGDTLNQVADLANLPGNAAPPAVIADAARRLARDAGLGCRIYDEAALRRERCGALLAVAAGSRQPPRVVVLRHPGVGAARREKPIVLVGKTLTFDSGGISLKPGAGMEWMRYDKSGGMAVLAAVLAAARLRLRRPVIGLLAAAENMPDGGATRPGDVVRTRAGRTVEILNTDAEGRLVLADALSLAGDLNPAAVVDLATLTGAAKIALGAPASALCSADEALGAELIAAGRAAGDRCWPLPLWPEYDEMLQTPFADLKNIGDGSAGTIAGAAFLKAFAPKGVPWAHIDIAATAWLEKEQPHRFPGATLSGARMLIEWLRNA